MEKILFKRPCIYKGKLFEQITVSYPNRYSSYYTISAFIDGIYTFVLYDHYPRENKKTIMNKLIEKDSCTK